MLLKTVRFKIIFWYAVLLSFTLLLFAVVLYNTFEHDLYDNLDNFLKAEAKNVENAITNYWDAAEREAVLDGDEDTYNTLRQREFNTVTQSLVEEEESLDEPKLLRPIIQVFATDGSYIAVSKNFSRRIPLTEDSLKAALKGKKIFTEYTTNLSGGNIVTLRSYTMAVFELKKPVYIISVSRTLASVNTALNRLKLLLFILLPLSVFLTAIAGIFLARVGLKPIVDMSEEIKKLTEKDLKTNIKVPDTDDEIEYLAEHFNQLITRLDRAFTLQQQFIQDASHELKTPLAIVRGQIEVELKRKRSAADYEKILKNNLEEIGKLGWIVENLLLLARYDSDKAGLEFKKLDLDKLLAELLENFEVLAKEKKITLKYEPGKRAEVMGDESQLKRLFVNLLDNAIKYTDKGGRVEIKLGKKNGFAAVEIKDTGMGIPKKDLKNIFNRFYRVDKARSSKGFGLGLSIARSIVTAHGGKLGVKSKINKGSLFSVYLPFPK